MPPLTRRAGRKYLLALVVGLLVFAQSVLWAPTATASQIKDMQWYLEAMQAEQMWKTSKGSGITIAVLDGGVDGSLPELQGQLGKGKNFFSPTKSAHRDLSGHGTSMASLIAGTGEGGGIQGLAPEAKIMPLTISPGTVDLFTFVAEAIHYAVDHGADIINMSFGGLGKSSMPKVTEAIDRANKEGVLLFAGSGNRGTDELSYPAAFPGVVAVSAGDKEGNVTDFSQYGGHVALNAPGDEMAMRCDDNSSTCKSLGGTSAATALTSASAALIWSKYPDWTANQVLRVMLETAGRESASDGPSKYVGHGAVRPRIALANENINPGDPDKNPLFSRYQEENDPTASPTPSTEDDRDSDARNDSNGASDAKTVGESEASAQEKNHALAYGLFAVGAICAVAAVTLTVRRLKK